MSLKHLQMSDVSGVYFVPQAILNLSPATLARHLSVDFLRGHDDLDDYEGAAFALNGHLPFTVMHYRGHPPGTVTLYLPYDIREVEKITKLVGVILSELGLSNDVLGWQRADDPDS
jgi:hypothetical protein